MLHRDTIFRMFCTVYENLQKFNVFFNKCTVSESVIYLSIQYKREFFC